MEFISLLFASLPIIVVLIVSTVFVVYAGVTLSKPRFVVYPYLVILLTVSGTTFGLKEAVAPSIWGRGSGLLYAPLIMWLLLGAFLWMRFTLVFARGRPVACNLNSWFGGWLLLLIAHIGFGLALGQPFKDIVGGMGFSNLIWMWVLMLAMFAAFRSPADVEELTKFLIVFGLGRALFGLVRWAAFGGDPANAYANRSGLDLKLTFFDINDNLLCFIALALASVRLLHPDQHTFNRWWRWLLWITVAATSLCILLSFRRTAWVGLMLGGLFLLLQLPSRTRWRVAFLVVPVGLLGIAYVAKKRLSQVTGAGDGINAFFYDLISKRHGAEGDRVLELKFAFADFIDHPIAGIGAWGRYAGYQRIDWQTGPDAGAFLHSGILHIGLKTGLIGLILLGGIVFAFIMFWRQNREALKPLSRPLALSGVGGLLFMLPDFIIGTPIPQVRTMQMIALCIALPYLAIGASNIGVAPVKSVRKPSGNDVFAPQLQG